MRLFLLLQKIEKIEKYVKKCEKLTKLGRFINEEKKIMVYKKLPTISEKTLLLHFLMSDYFFVFTTTTTAKQ